jgi:hypothetical protein
MVFTIQKVWRSLEQMTFCGRHSGMFLLYHYLIMYRYHKTRQGSIFWSKINNHTLLSIFRYLDVCMEVDLHVYIELG